MAKNFAIMVFEGNVGKAPVMRFTQNNSQEVTDFNVAINQHDGSVEWVKVTAWGKQAKNCCDYVTKGMRVLVSGTPSINRWANNQGEAQSNLAVNARDVQFLGGGEAKTQQQGSQEGSGQGSGKPHYQPLPPGGRGDNVPF